MEEDQTYLAPDYFPTFRCKMGACRRACCEGWPVTITMNDYFRLLGAPCSPDLRRRIDCALHLAPHPSPEGYAQITPRYDGQCPLRNEDGLCALQMELGEEALALVCRLYPRGIRYGEALECSCANSCEAVPEMLLHRREPLTFIPVRRALPMPGSMTRRHSFNAEGRERAIRLWLISLVQDRRFPLAQRIYGLGLAMKVMEQALNTHDMARVDELLTKRAEEVAFAMPQISGEELHGGLDLMEQVLAVVDAHSDSVRAWGEAALTYFGTGEEAFARYRAADERLNTLIPDCDTWMEHLLVNHMYFEQFPFQDRPVPLPDEYLALCVVYMLLRFVSLGAAATHNTTEAVVDATAAVFRLTEHTTFDCYAAPLLRQLGVHEWNQLVPLLCL